MYAPVHLVEKKNIKKKTIGKHLRHRQCVFYVVETLYLMIFNFYDNYISLRHTISWYTM